MNKDYRAVRPRFWLLLIVAFAAAAVAVYSAQSRYLDRQQATIEELTRQRDQLVAENEELQRKIEFTYTDEYIEREARSKLGLVKEDEILFETN